MSEIVIYEDKESQQSVEVRLDGETVWLTQRQMSELFGTSSDNISLHLKNIYAEKELSEPATTEDFSVVQIEGKRKVTRQIKHYNLDAIISAAGQKRRSKRTSTQPGSFGLSTKQEKTRSKENGYARYPEISHNNPGPCCD